MDERSFHHQMRDNATENADLLRRRIDGVADKSKVSVQHVLNLLRWEILLEQPKIDTSELTPEQTLEQLDRAEKWYKDREMEFPNQKWLKERRDSLGVKDKS